MHSTLCAVVDDYVISLDILSNCGESINQQVIWCLKIHVCLCVCLNRLTSPPLGFEHLGYGCYLGQAWPSEEMKTDWSNASLPATFWKLKEDVKYSAV